MTTNQPIITTQRGRQMACTPAANVAFIVDEQERILMLSNPKTNGWEPVNGALDAGETLMESLLREIREEAGDQIRARPLGLVHAFNFAYDPTVPYVISLCWVLKYEGGEVIPGDDMRGSDVHWFTVEELESGDYDIVVPRDVPWIFRRVVDLYHLYKNGPTVELQPEIDPSQARPKYGKT